MPGPETGRGRPPKSGPERAEEASRTGRGGDRGRGRERGGFRLQRTLAQALVVTVIVCLVAFTVLVGRQLDDSPDGDRPRLRRAWGLPRRRPPGLTRATLALALLDHRP